MLEPRQQMLAPAGLRVNKCVGHRSPVSVSGHLEKETTWHRVRAKVDENKTPNLSRDRGVEVRKSGRPDATWTPSGC